MRVLAIETATPWGSVAVVGPAGVLAEESAHVPRKHLEWLVPAIDAVLVGAGLAKDAIEGLAVSLGPGGFSGLRIGLATASAWAVAAGVPLVGVSTLETIAAGAVGIDPAAPGGASLVLAAIDVRRGEIAAALFRSGRPPTRLTPDLVLSPAALGDALPPISAGERILVAGDALERYSDAVLAALPPSAVAAPPREWRPKASVSGALGRVRLVRGEGDDPLSLVPRYARHPDAREYAS